MARFARVVAVDFPHHITHRGNRQADVFLRDEDRLLYLRLLAQYSLSAQLDIWGYCLMSNHVHLIVVPRREDSLARGVGLAHRRYATILNKRNGGSGHLRANRFFSTPLDEAHQWQAIRYVERNPVAANMVAQAEDYAWSSARIHALGHDDSLLSPERPWPGPVADWAAWLGLPQGIDAAAQTRRLRECTRTGRPCGGINFVASLERRRGRVLLPRKRGRKLKTEQSPTQPESPGKREASK